MLQALVTLARERKVTGVVGGVGLTIFATQLFSMTRTVVNVAFPVKKRRGVFHGFLFDVFAGADAPYRRRGDPRRRRRAVRPPERLADYAPLPGLGRARRAARRRRAAGPGRWSSHRRPATVDQPMEAPRPAPAARGESADCGAGLEPMTEGQAHAPGPP